MTRLRQRPRRPRIIAVLSALTLLLSLGAAVAAGPAQADSTTSTSIAVDGSQGGRTFDGIGAISGGGGNSRLLINYPEPERSQILDYLFKPGYGAALQILKAEIGGDSNSTDGAESSIEHTAGAIDCNTGYEWWLMEQAKARNPRIRFYGLAWAAPGWIGSGNFWSTDMINYLVSWLGCAKSHGLAISYLGGWNENGYSIPWYEQLRSTLDADGYAKVQIVGADDADWNIATDMASNAAFNSAVSIIGAHYPCGGDGSPADTCSSTPAAVSLNKPLWASENGSQDDNAGAPAMARSINRGYTDAKMTAYINWPLIASIPDGLPFETTGLMVANQPWSGQFSVGSSLWVAAQTTQFAQPGWTYIDSASGYLGGTESNGTYVTLKSPNHRDYSTIIETTTATAAQTAHFTVSGGLSTAAVHVWATNLNSADSSDWFVHTANIRPSDGQYTLTLQPGYVYSVTTTTGQGKGGALSPPPANFGLPYSDSLAGYPLSSEPQYLADQDGAFQVVNCTGRRGKCLRQMVTQVPTEWAQHTGTPYTIVGDDTWANYTVSSDVMLQKPGSVELLGRYEARNYYEIGDNNAYYLRVTNTGGWQILKNDTSGEETTLASGQAKAIGVGSWHKLALTFDGSTITAAIDGKTVGSGTDASYPYGPAGLGVGLADHGAVTGSNLFTQPTGQLTWNGPFQLSTGPVAGTVQAATTPQGDSAIGWIQSGAQANTWIQVTPAGLTDGTTYQASVTLQGSGDVYLDFYNGSSDVTSQPVQLSATPVTLTVSTQVSGGNAPQFQVRTAGAGDVNLMASNAQLYQQTPAGWIPAEFANLSVTPVHPTVAALGADYMLVNRQTGKLLAVSGRGCAVQSTDTGAAAQHWYLQASGSQPGSDELVSAASGKVLDTVGRGGLCAGPASSAGTAVGSRAGAAQLWRVQPHATGGYTLISRATGRAIGVAGRRPASAPVSQLPVSAAAGEQWDLMPVPYANLAASYDNTAVTDDTNTDPSPSFIGFDGIGTSYSAQGLATDGLTPGATVTADGTKLTWPDVASGQPDNTMALGQTIALPGSGTSLTFLTAANNAPQSGQVTVYYTDGTTSTAQLDVGNFWFAPGQSGNPASTQVAAVNYANYPTGSSGHTIYLFADSVPLTAGKTVSEVTLPALSGVAGDNAALHIFAMGIS